MSANQLTKSDIVELIDVNQLVYSRTSPTNPVVSRTQKKSYAEGGSGTSYGPNDHLIVNLQSGVELIDPLQSFLVFDLKVGRSDAVIPTTNLTPSFIGSAVNLFRDSQISTRSGREMDRVEDLNWLQYHLLRSNSDEWIKFNGQALMKANYETVGAAIPARAKVGLTSTKVMIPLKYISPIFESDKLMPSHLARGMRIDITCETFGRALTLLDDALIPASDVNTYSITKPYILTDNYRMDDSVLEYLNAEFASKEKGLIYEYPSWHTTKTSIANNDINIEVRRTVSMALDVFAVDSLSFNKSLASANSFASTPMDEGDRTQWRIGSHYLPNTSVEGSVEHYAQMIYWSNKLRKDMPCGIDYDTFVGSNGQVPGTSTNYGHGKYCTTLQRNNILALSGIAINNSSTLSIDGVFGGVAAGRDVDLFLRHIRRAICFLESTLLET